jgi:hypothetical protein
MRSCGREFVKLRYGMRSIPIGSTNSSTTRRRATQGAGALCLLLEVNIITS